MHGKKKETSPRRPLLLGDQKVSKQKAQEGRSAPETTEGQSRVGDQKVKGDQKVSKKNPGRAVHLMETRRSVMKTRRSVSPLASLKKRGSLL